MIKNDFVGWLVGSKKNYNKISYLNNNILILKYYPSRPSSTARDCACFQPSELHAAAVGVVVRWQLVLGAARARTSGSAPISAPTKSNEKERRTRFGFGFSCDLRFPPQATKTTTTKKQK